MRRVEGVSARPFVEIIDQLLAIIQKRAGNRVGILRPVSFDPKGRHAGTGVGFDGDEMVIAREQRFEIFAPKQDTRKPRDEIAFRPAEDRPQVLFLLEFANRVARHHKVLDGAGVFRCAAQPGGLKQRTDPARLHLFRAADNELGLR